MAGDPRIRGGHEDKRYADWDRAGSSPHTRGARAHRLLKPSGVCIIPAYAGSTTSSPTRWRRPKDHPRIRGEHFQTFMADIAERGSSPHTRGAPAGHSVAASDARIIPAYAGSTNSCPCGPSLRFGSSPHTRGALVAEDDSSLPGGIIPAYAGSTGLWPLGAGRRRDHPRIRGEHAVIGVPFSLSSGSSPHTRGALGLEGGVPRDPGIIPAYAGSTSSRSPAKPSPADHPRIRGEHAWKSLQYQGSPP